MVDVEAPEEVEADKKSEDDVEDEGTLLIYP